MNRFVKILALGSMLFWVLTVDYSGTSAILMFVLANKPVFAGLFVAGLGWELYQAGFEWE